MFCRRCGSEANEDDQFCRSCGQPQGAVTTKTSALTTPSVTIRNAYIGKDQQIWGGLVFMVGLLGMLASCGSQGGKALGFFSLLSVVGLSINFVGRFRHWYHAE